MNTEEIVNNIYKEKAKNDSNSKDLSRGLDVLSKTVFGDVNRFVFELLQNADDSSIEEKKDIKVDFHILENYLIFSHDGAHFAENDVVGISSIGNRASEKDQSIEKTGYKGIGFKSVFGTSDYVHIVSGGFSFRFDKNHTAWNNDENYPWQVIPIWTEEPVEEVADWINTENVNTIIGIKNKKSISDEVIKVFKDCQILLFLRRVHSITFSDNGNVVFKISKNDTTSGVIDLYDNARLVSSWVTKTFILPIDGDLTKKLEKLSDVECPQKLKEAENTKITFAACVEENQFIPLKAAVIYSYLPTKAAQGFPFLINGDFLTNAERTELLPNIWNEFLFTQIATKKLEWFAELQATDFKYEILKLFKGKYTAYSATDIENSYNTSLSNGASTIPFLPQEQSTQLISINNAIVDIPQFCSLFEPKLVTDFLSANPYQRVLDLKLVGQSNLAGLGSKQFSFPQLLDLIASGVIVDPLEATNIIVFFYNNTLGEKNKAWLTSLANAVFILDESGNYKTPKEIFIPGSSDETVEFDFDDISYVHSTILDHFKNAFDVIKWLQALGVREPTELEIVKKALIPFILNDRVTEDNFLKVTRFIFKVFCAGLLQDLDYQTLKSLKLQTLNGLALPRRTYLSDKYNPEKKLSTIIPNANFVSDLYPEDDESIPNWKAFFKNIGIRESISIEVLQDKSERTDFVTYNPYAAPYFNWLDANTHYPEIYRPYRLQGQHYIQYFTSIDFRDHLQEVDFSKYFWSKMLQNWDIFKERCSHTTYFYYGGKNNIIPSFVEYFIQNHNAIPCTDGNCHPSLNVFAPSLKSVIGNYFPVADFPSAMTNEQVEFFGFKRTISIRDCLSLLNTIADQVVNSEVTKQISSIYDQLINQSGDVSKATRATIEDWRKSATLLTLSNSFQPIEDLFCFSVHGANAPINSERFVKLTITRFEELEAFCNLLSIPVITFDVLQFIPEGVVTEDSLHKTLKLKSKFLALLHSNKSNENYNKVLSGVNNIFAETQFFQAEKLNLIYKSDSGEVIFDSKINSWNDKGKRFYYIGKWNSPLTLYDLSSTICSLLGFKYLEREIQLILQLSDEEIIGWLAEQGYNTEIITADSDEYIQEEFIIPEDNKFDGVDIEIEETFIPKIKASEIDYQNVHPVNKEFVNVAPPSPQEYVRISNQKVMVDIGRWSEEFVFGYLKKNTSIYTDIDWLNEDKESMLPYDFKVVEDGITKFIEVKGTPSASKEMIYMSPAEWKVMFDNGINYSIFRIYGAGTKDVKFERIDNVRLMVESGIVMPSPIQLII